MQWSSSGPCGDAAREEAIVGVDQHIRYRLALRDDRDGRPSSVEGRRLALGPLTEVVANRIHRRVEPYLPRTERSLIEHEPVLAGAHRSGSSVQWLSIAHNLARWRLPTSGHPSRPRGSIPPDLPH